MKISGLKIILIIAAIILVILAIVPLYINPLAHRLIEQNVYPFFENRLKIGSVNVSLLLWMVELKDIELRQPAGFGDIPMLKASSIKGYFSALPVLNNQLSLRDIAVINPEFTLILRRDEKINTDYIIASKPENPDTKQSAIAIKDKNLTSSVPAESAAKPFTVTISQLDIKNGTFTMYNQKIRRNDPTLVISDLKITVKDLVSPNAGNTKTTFTISGSLTSKQNKAPLSGSGEGLFFKKPFALDAKIKIKNIDLSDYYYFYTDTAVKIKDGNAWVDSKISISNDYLDSTHHVDVKNLSLTSGDKTLLGKTFLGLPAAGLVKVLEASQGKLDFDFQIKVNLNNLKFKMRDKIIMEITRSLTQRIGSLAGNALSVPEKAKDLGYKAVDELNKLFNKMK
jgi:hypothetical protein